MSPETAADLVIEAVRANRLLALTHRDASHHLLRDHLEAIIG